MPTQCNAKSFEFARVESRRVVASFDGGAVTSDAGSLLLGATDRAIGLVERFAGCFADHRRADLIEHDVRTLVSQRIFGIALGYEDLNDHDELRHDPVMATLVGKLSAGRRDCAPLAGKSTLNRVELSRTEPTRYHKIRHDPEAIENLFVTLFVEAHNKAPGRSSSILMPPMIRSMAIRKGGSFTAITTAIAICRSTFSVGGICWRPSCAVRTSMGRPAPARSSSALSRKSGVAGRAPASCCVPTAASAARP